MDDLPTELTVEPLAPRLREEEEGHGTGLALDLEGPVTDGFRTVATFVPKLLGFLVILLVGYFIAKIVAKVVDKLLERPT